MVFRGLCGLVAVALVGTNLLAQDAKLAAARLVRVPDAADLVLVVESPRKLVEQSRGLPGVRSALQAPWFQEVFETPGWEQFENLLKAYQAESGADWPEALDDLSGGGLVLATKTGTDRVLVHGAGNHEARTKSWFRRTCAFIRSEQEKTAETPPKWLETEVDGAQVFGLEGEFLLASRGAEWWFSNHREALQRSLQSLASSKQTTNRLKARELFSDHPPLAWLWFDLASLKETPAGMDFYANTRRDVLQNLVLGSTIDALSRADFVAAAWRVQDQQLRLTVRLPAQRSELREEMALHVPPASLPGLWPPLEPRGALASLSFYLDTRTFYQKRNKLINEVQLKDFEQGLSDIHRFVPNQTLPELFEGLQPYHRLVMLDRVSPLYQSATGQPIPAFAYIGQLRPGVHPRVATTWLRGLGFLGSLTAGLKMTETTVAGKPATIYHFAESFRWDQDPSGTRFQFRPCFVVDGSNIVVASRPDALEPILEALAAERARKAPLPAGGPVWRASILNTGLAQLIQAQPEPFVAQVLLTRNRTVAQAEAEVKQFSSWLAQQGRLEISIEHHANYYEWQASWNVDQPGATR